MTSPASSCNGAAVTVAATGPGLPGFCMLEPKTMNRTEWGLLILLSVLWGGAFFCVGVAVAELPPLTVVLARVGIAAMALLALSWFLGHALPRGFSAWTPFLVMGLLNNVLPFSLLNAGQTMVSVGLASIMNAMTPLFTALVMASFREERLSAYRVIGVLLGLVGVAVIARPDALSEDARLVGIGLCLSATLSYGFAALWGRRHGPTLRRSTPRPASSCHRPSSSRSRSPSSIGRGHCRCPEPGSGWPWERWPCSGPRSPTSSFSKFSSAPGAATSAGHAADAGDRAAARKPVPRRADPRVRDCRGHDPRPGLAVHRRQGSSQGNPPYRYSAGCPSPPMNSRRMQRPESRIYLPCGVRSQRCGAMRISSTTEIVPARPISSNKTSPEATPRPVSDLMFT